MDEGSDRVQPLVPLRLLHLLQTHEAALMPILVLLANSIHEVHPRKDVPYA